MPLYEIVLCYSHGDEVRLTDQPLAIGDTMQIDYVDWKVVLESPPAGATAAARYVCEPLAAVELAPARSGPASQRRPRSTRRAAAADGA
jgi:hypothetical protein